MYYDDSSLDKNKYGRTLVTKCLNWIPFAQI